MRNLFIGILAIWLISAAIIVCFGPESPGAFGDSFGALNTLSSGLAFAAIYFSLENERSGRNEEEARHREIIELQVLTAYVDVMKTCWLNNELKAQNQDIGANRQFWEESSVQRYKQMLHTLEQIEKRIVPAILAKSKELEGRRGS